jgi:signal peptidase I
VQFATQQQGFLAKRKLPIFLAVVGFVALVVMIAVIANAEKLRALHLYRIASPSMEPTIYEGDGIAVDESYYVQHIVADGDLVVFRHGEYVLVKRVLALAGDTIEGRDEVLFRNGSALKEPYAEFSAKNPIPEIETFAPLRVSPGEIFVAGDNRDKSLDSRSAEFGPVRLSDVIGEARFVYLSHHSGQIGRSLSSR